MRNYGRTHGCRTQQENQNHRGRRPHRESVPGMRKGLGHPDRPGKARPPSLLTLHTSGLYRHVEPGRTSRSPTTHQTATRPAASIFSTRDTPNPSDGLEPTARGVLAHDCRNIRIRHLPGNSPLKPWEPNWLRSPVCPDVAYATLIKSLVRLPEDPDLPAGALLLPMTLGRASVEPCPRA